MKKINAPLNNGAVNSMSVVAGAPLNNGAVLRTNGEVDTLTEAVICKKINAPSDDGALKLRTFIRPLLYYWVSA